MKNKIILGLVVNLGLSVLVGLAISATPLSVAVLLPLIGQVSLVVGAVGLFLSVVMISRTKGEDDFFMGLALPLIVTLVAAIIVMAFTVCYNAAAHIGLLPAWDLVAFSK